MDSPDNEKGRYADEVLHQVMLTKGFWLAETTVTQALWQAVKSDNPSRFKGDNCPVENVSWHDAQDLFNN
jgi:formylglycine-generating enzyme